MKRIIKRVLLAVVSVMVLISMCEINSYAKSEDDIYLAKDSDIWKSLTDEKSD